MREVYVDLSVDNPHREVKVFGGHSGEHNETLLKVKLPPRMLSEGILYYYFMFETSCGDRILSVPIDSSNVKESIVETFLWEQVTKQGTLKVNVVATDETIENSPNRRSMTDTIVLTIKSSPNGKDVVIDPNAVRVQLLELIDQRVLQDLENIQLITIDQDYNPESSNPQSGKAVAQALQGAGGGGVTAPSNSEQISHFLQFLGASENVKEALDVIENYEMVQDQMIMRLEDSANKHENEISGINEVIVSLQNQINNLPTVDEIVDAVIETLGYPVFGTVDENNIITLSGKVPDGTYTFNFEMEDGSEVTIGTLVKGEVEPAYTNLLPTAVNADGSDFVGTHANGGDGYEYGYRIRGTGEEQTVSGDEYSTGYIRIDPDTSTEYANENLKVYIKNVTLNSNESYNNLVFFDQNHNTITATSIAAKGYDAINLLDNDVWEITIGKVTQSKDIYYFRVCFGSITDETIITVNEPIV